MNDVKNIQDWYGIFVMIGSFGGGKTASGFLFGFNLLRYDTYIKHSNLDGKYYERSFCLYKTTPFLVEKAKEKCRAYCLENGLEDLSNRIYLANDESEIRDNSFCLADEGISLFFKEDQNRKDQKEFVKDITELRHHRITWFINSGDYDLSTKIRNKATWELYKTQSRKALENNKKIDSFLQKYKKELMSLEITEFVFNTTDKWFVKNIREGYKNGRYIEGKLSLDISDKTFGVPFFDAELSESNDSKSYATRIQNLTERQKLFDPIIMNILKNCDPEKISKADWRLYVLGHIQDNFKDNYSAITQYKQEFFERFVHIKKDGFESDRKLYSDIKMKPNFTFPDYMKENIIDRLESDIIFLWLGGLGQMKIESELHKSIGTINDMVRNYQEKQIGYSLEDFIHLLFGYDPKKVHNKHGIPDFIDQKGVVKESGSIFSIKFRDTLGNRERFTLEELQNELNYANDSGLDHFYLLFFSPKWSSKALFLVKLMNKEVLEAKEYIIIRSKFGFDNKDLTDSKTYVIELQENNSN